MTYERKIISVSLLFGFLCFHSSTLYAESEVNGTGRIGFEGEYAQVIVDPENPTAEAEPGAGPSTTGDLRLDFVSSFHFGANKISDKDETYYGNAQLFFGATEPRGSFVQVSDYRGTGAGWTLQLRQETQFRNEATTNKELKGAVISLDNSWINSTRDKKEAPSVSKDVIKIDSIGETYNLAEASTGKGQGTWSIIFGASSENKSGQENTLTPRLDSNGNKIKDPDFENKEIYQNSALRLSVPGATSKDQVAYQTVLTWILSELP